MAIHYHMTINVALHTCVYIYIYVTIYHDRFNVHHWMAEAAHVQVFPATLTKQRPTKPMMSEGGGAEEGGKGRGKGKGHTVKLLSIP